MEKVYNLRRASSVLELGVEQLGNMIVSSEVMDIQLGGPRSKSLIPAHEIKRLRAPIRLRTK